MPSIISGSDRLGSDTISFDELLLLLLQAPHSIEKINRKSHFIMKARYISIVFLRQNYEL
jgi:hypothetical protein